MGWAAFSAHAYRPATAQQQHLTLIRPTKPFFFPTWSFSPPMFPLCLSITPSRCTPQKTTAPWNDSLEKKMVCPYSPLFMYSLILWHLTNICRFHTCDLDPPTFYIDPPIPFLDKKPLENDITSDTIALWWAPEPYCRRSG